MAAHLLPAHREGVPPSFEAVSSTPRRGQWPRDVNKFLTYSSPTASHTSLPTGTTTYPLMIFYGQTILPASFRAELNGADISTWFHPTTGGHEVVSLPVRPGRNVVVLSVDGNLPNRVATDTDRLVFLVP